jgi:hypothetical protein
MKSTHDIVIDRIAGLPTLKGAWCDPRGQISKEELSIPLLYSLVGFLEERFYIVLPMK